MADVETNHSNPPLPGARPGHPESLNCPAEENTLEHAALPDSAKLAAPTGRHAIFDLPMHADEELAALTGGSVSSRQTLHEWPLSCVQKLEKGDGKLIYKSQAGPTLEPEFYAAARSPLLVDTRCVYRSADHAASLIEFVDAPLLAVSLGDAADCLAYGRELTEAIAAIEGELPCFQDLSSPARWSEYMAGLERSLRELSQRGFLPSLPGVSIDELVRTGNDPAMRAFFSAPAQLLHGDLKGENVFKVDGGFKVIDWQFPRRGPAAIDQAILMETAGHDPVPHLGIEALRAVYFIRMEWFAQCSLRWIPEGRHFYDGAICGLAKAIADGRRL